MVSLRDQYLTPCFFLLYVNDLPKITDEYSKLILFADDTSIITTSPNPTNFEYSVNKIFHDINRWFNTNLLSLNLDKTHYMQFVTKNSSVVDLKIIHGSNNITNTCSTKFLGITLDNTLSSKTWLHPNWVQLALRFELLNHSCLQNP
jgi:hypothetical protein